MSAAVPGLMPRVSVCNKSNLPCHLPAPPTFFLPCFCAFFCPRCCCCAASSSASSSSMIALLLSPAGTTGRSGHDQPCKPAELHAAGPRCAWQEAHPACAATPAASAGAGRCAAPGPSAHWRGARGSASAARCSRGATLASAGGQKRPPNSPNAPGQASGRPEGPTLAAAACECSMPPADHPSWPSRPTVQSGSKQTSMAR